MVVINNKIPVVHQIIAHDAQKIGNIGMLIKAAKISPNSQYTFIQGLRYKIWSRPEQRQGCL